MKRNNVFILIWLVLVIASIAAIVDSLAFNYVLGSDSYIYCLIALAVILVAGLVIGKLPDEENKVEEIDELKEVGKYYKTNNDITHRKPVEQTYVIARLEGNRKFKIYQDLTVINLLTEKEVGYWNGNNKYISYTVNGKRYTKNVKVLYNSLIEEYNESKFHVIL